MEQELEKEILEPGGGFIHGVSLPANGEPRQSPWGQLLDVWWATWLKVTGSCQQLFGCFL